jgi:hypothetical protein
MKLELAIFAISTDENIRAGRRFHFAIVDSDKPGGYPRNFVCLLPYRVTEVGKSNSVFLNIFGNKGVEQARRLLTEALKKERSGKIKNEIRRRLELLDPKGRTQIKCRSCGKVFETNRARKSPNYPCEGCRNKA